jgi:hypothetical protein
MQNKEHVGLTIGGEPRKEDYAAGEDVLAKYDRQSRVTTKHAVRTIQDEEVRDMIAFYQTLDMGVVLKNNTIAMLEELLKLREKVRNDA